MTVILMMCACVFIAGVVAATHGYTRMGGAK